METMFDSITAKDIPQSATIVAGYLNNRYAWSPNDWTIHKTAKKVPIWVPQTNMHPVEDAQQAVVAAQRDVYLIPGSTIVLDIEANQAPYYTSYCKAWSLEIAKQLYMPCAYTSRSTQDLVTAGHYWIADYTHVPHSLPNSHAVQYSNPPKSGGHFDLSCCQIGFPCIGGTFPMTPYQSKIPGNGTITSITATSWSLGRLDLFAASTDGNVYHQWYSETGWSGWSTT